MRYGAILFVAILLIAMHDPKAQDAIRAYCLFFDNHKGTLTVDDAWVAQYTCEFDSAKECNETVEALRQLGHEAHCRSLVEVNKILFPDPE